MAGLFAEALERGAGGTTRALSRVARAFGRQLAEETTIRGRSRRARAKLAQAAVAALEPLGFEPACQTGGEVRLRNCPFHALAERHRGLVCGTNLALLQGFVSGLGVPQLRAVLDPRPGMCCVALRPAPGTRAGRPAGRGRSR